MFKTSSSFSGSLILRYRPFKVSYSYSFGFDGLQKMQNFCWKMFESQSENTWRWSDIEHIESMLKKIILKSTDAMPTSIVHISNLCDLFYWSASHFCLVTLWCWSVLLHNIYLYNAGKKDYDRPFLSFTDSIHSAYYKQYNAELQFNGKHNQ